jgi:hypothetical protein
MNKQEVIKTIDRMMTDDVLRAKILEQLYWIAYSDGKDLQAGQKFSSMVTKEVKRTLGLQNRQ